jgi:hypothetical protein
MSGPLAAFADTSLRHSPQFNAKSRTTLLAMNPHQDGAWKRRRPWSSLVARMAKRFADKVISDPEESLAQTRIFYEKEVAQHGVDGQRTVAARGEVAKRLERLERYEEATPLREENLQICRRKLGPEDITTLTCEEWLVGNLLDCGRFEDASELGGHLYEALQRTAGPDHEDTLRVADLLEVIEQGRNE